MNRIGKLVQWQCGRPLTRNAAAILAAWAIQWMTACAPATTTSVEADGSVASASCTSNSLQNVRVGKDASGEPIFRLNGAPWMPRGVQIRGFVSSIPTAQFLGDQETIDAQQVYGTPELDAVTHTFQANMLRFQVSQHDLDAADDRSDGSPVALHLSPVGANI